MAITINGQKVLYVNSDNVWKIGNLTSNYSGSAANSAEITGTLKSKSGTTLGTFEMDYIEDSDGAYVGTIPSTVTSGLTVGTKYNIELAIVQGSFDAIYYFSDLLALKAGA